MWVYGLGYRDKFKAVVLRINYMYNLVLFAITHEFWTPYHNFGVFYWYNEEHYEWVHRKIIATYTVPWTRYKYYANK